MKDDNKMPMKFWSKTGECLQLHDMNTWKHPLNINVLPSMFIKCMDTFFTIFIPQFYSFVVTARND